jgi:glycine oxidase
MEDVLVIGGGVMGCASALALAEAGVSVRVLERSVPGAEASSAAAGILGAQIEAHTDGPMARLCLASRALYPALAARLHERTGIDAGLRMQGTLHVAWDEGELDTLWDNAAWQRDAGLRCERLGPAALREREPCVSPDALGGVYFPDDGRIDPPLLLKALRIGAERAGARFSSGALVRRIVVEDARATGVLLEDGRVIEAKHVVLAAGSWSALVEGSGLPPECVRPARGQIVELLLELPPTGRVLYGPGCYLSPRDDGRMLIGSTLEFVGFSPGVTALAVRDLLTAAIRLVPRLGRAGLGRAWSSFRPYTRDELPLLGRTPIEGLLLATGHYRNGILLAPITGQVIASAVLGTEPPAELTPFSSARVRTAVAS